MSADNGSERVGGGTRRPFRRSAGAAWVRLARPWTSMGLGLAGAAMTLAWTDGGAAWHIALRYGLAVGLAALAAGAANDAADRGRDEAHRVWRPLPSGRVSERAARVAAVVATAAALGLAFSLEWRSGAALAAAGAAGAVYSYGWRGSALGWAPFALTAILLPLGAAAAAGEELAGALWWTAPVGGASGLALFLVYKLPEFERDDEDESRSVLHWLGIDAAVPTTWAVLAAALALAAASANFDGVETTWLLPPFVYLLAVSVGCIGALVLEVNEPRLEWQRRLVGPGLAALMVGWLGAIAPG